MNTKNVLTAIGIVYLLEGLGFYFAAESITSTGFPNLTGNALEVGTLMHQALASFVLAIGIVLLFARTIEENAAKKVLMGLGFANLLILANTFNHYFNSPAKPPMQAIVMIVLIAALSFYTATKKSA